MAPKPSDSASALARGGGGHRLDDGRPANPAHRSGECDDANPTDTASGGTVPAGATAALMLADGTLFWVAGSVPIPPQRRQWVKCASAPA